MREWKGDWSDGDVMWDDFPEVAKAANYNVRSEWPIGKVDLLVGSCQ